MTHPSIHSVDALRTGESTLGETYMARVNEIADSAESAGTKMLLQAFAMFDEVLVHDVFSRPREEWAGALRELHMTRVAAAIEQATTAEK